MSTATYKGRFKKPRRPKANLNSTALVKGYHSTIEQFGNVIDQHCGVITHSTIHHMQVARAMMGALLRKLFFQAGINVDNRSNILGLFTDTSNSLTYRIRMTQKHEQINGVNYTNHDITAGDSLSSIVEAFGGTQEIYYVLVARPSYDNLRFAEIWLEQLQIVTGVPTTLAKLRLSNEKLTLFAKSKLRVQNRTKGDAVDHDADADRVDNLPLMGKIYNFNGAHPKLRSYDNDDDIKKTMNCIGPNGLVLGRGIDLEEMNEPPNHKIFKNCTGTSKVVLNPGSIKDASIFYKVSGYFNDVIDKLKVKSYVAMSGDPPPLLLYGGVGKSQTIFLEEMIRSITSNDIIMVYERELITGCWFDTKQRRGALTTRLTHEQISANGA
jgi:hypothetical protein